MGVFGRSWELVKESWGVLRKDKEIMFLPIISGIVTILLLISFIVPGYYIYTQTGQFSASLAALFFAYYFISYFFIVFFNSAIVACAHIRLNGGDPKVRDGLRYASKHVGKIFLWSILSATVGLVLRIISERFKLLGSIVAWIIGLLWSLLTFFVIPVIIFEDKGVVSSIKRSGQLFRKAYGEEIVGHFSIGLIFFGLALIGLVPLLIAFLLKSLIFMLTAGIFLIVYILILGIISSSLGGIFVAALYSYASTGNVPSSFRPETVKNAFRSRTPAS